MANFHKSHPLNVPGPLFTDHSCIDCGTCYHIGPALFREGQADNKSVVIKQPQGTSEWQIAKRAIFSCPTNSIGTHHAPEDFKLVGPGLPEHIIDNIFYLGYTSRDSFGATAYLIKRDEGNILVDSPRFHPWLISELEKAGGAKYMFLTHQDDVADHQKFHSHFGLERIIHQDDVTDDTKACERILSGQDAIELASDLRVIMTPGHSRGHMNLLYQNRFLFTGDHMFVDSASRLLTASKGVCWYSWTEQIASMEKLLKEKFEWVLPGHGGWGCFGVEESHNKLKILIESMKGR